LIDRCEKPGNIGPTGNVAAESQDLLTGCSDSFQILLCQIDHFPITGTDRDVGTLSNKGFSDCSAKPLAGARDERDKVFQFHLFQQGNAIFPFAYS
jgi:hypothetical protein